MNWIIAPNMRCTLQFFTGINFSGTRTDIEVFPSGKNKELKEDEIQSVAVIAPKGVRIVLSSAPDIPSWEERAWRAIVFTDSDPFKTPEGKLAFRVPDLDHLDAPNARRTDPDFDQGYVQVKTLAEGTGWTFGRVGPAPLKGHVQTIRIDRLPTPATPKKK
jgi:hypothetical protein